MAGILWHDLQTKDGRFILAWALYFAHIHFIQHSSVQSKPHPDQAWLGEVHLDQVDTIAMLIKVQECLCLARLSCGKGRNYLIQIDNCPYSKLKYVNFFTGQIRGMGVRSVSEV